MPEVQILRGITGSGKSSYVDWFKLNCNARVTVVSADHDFMKDGSYQFDPALLPQAHDHALSRYASWLRNKPDGVAIVDNTNLSAWEIAPYYRLAEINKLPVKILTFLCSPEEAMARTVHGVPPNIIFKMHQKLLKEELPWPTEYWQGTRRFDTLPNFAATIR